MPVGAPPLQGPERWHTQLPTDLHRAAPEIYASLRAGALSTRDYLIQNFPGTREGPVFTDMWTLATAVDFKLDVPTEAERQRVLNTDDTVEMSLRRLASFIYERRTKDSVGAAHMLAMAAPGQGVDIAPSWL